MSDVRWNEVLGRWGAKGDAGRRPVAHFGNAPRELRAALDSCAVADGSDLARVIARGTDILDLLHRLSTNDVKGLTPGAGCATVLTSPKGRIVHRLLVSHLGEPGILMVAGPGRADGVREHIDRYTFAEQTGIEDLSADWGHVMVVGPRAAATLGRLGLRPPSTLQVECGSTGGIEVTVLGHDGRSGCGFSVVCDAEAAPALFDLLSEAASAEGGRPAGREAMEARRLLLGIPAEDKELTENHNPLEAGLRDAVDFGKGCYVGQEVVARLDTYDKVSRRLTGLRLARGLDPPKEGSALTRDGRAAGTVTSSLMPPGWTEAIALAYVRRPFWTAGTTLQVAGTATEATVADLPLHRRD